MQQDICGGAHRFFVASDGAVDGDIVVKVWLVVVCTVCKESHLIEHVMDKTAHLTKVSS